ncbi:phytoene desaturase family protein [Pseudohalioglobus lutimaris]|uniref:NAD(P)/FAD-dependent oxidoreductase n=1 Tax=Pseudohalioglobus lutimaris TaxID=1737061 RepID=A0A2N5WXY2_9GAMM|nr:NAD(P)/FAD-dependent oxidoreductase [Pseudohalioglobus lutimaris]PLW67087.1 NAD(P)/FAD-dependent oxidoreductase [Pseudohalioglobus lutimaris]
MTGKPSASEFDVIVIGSGIGGMTTATALSRLDHKVLLLEQAQTIGGLTHTFSRNGFTWDVGLHYCGTFGHEQHAGRILDWLSGGAIEFHSVGTVYDTLHFPDGFEISIGRPAEAYKMELKERFPDNVDEIDAYFEALRSAEEAGHMVGAERAMPEPFRFAHHWWNKKKIQRWCSRTTGEVIAELISNPRLAAVLSAQWGTYGGKPKEASFAIHAIIIGHYLEGAAYPVGGAAAIARGLVPVIEAAGGSARAGTPVREILLEEGKAVGVRTQSGEEFTAPCIVSAIGAGETVKHLLPEKSCEQDWAREIATFKPSICHFDLYLGFEGDIAQHGATRSNHWFYESWDTSDAIWTAGGSEPIQMMFVSFSSLKNPAHDPGPANRHTGDMLIWADWSSVAKFADGGADECADEWALFKQRVESRMLDFFADKFPQLAPLIVYHELGTPLATASFTGHEKGGFYGVETTPRRMLSDALNARTPVPGLFLAGQDVMTPGIAGALSGGMLGAAAIDPRVFQKLS